MFGNFIYFIVALLIYSTYQPSDQPNFSFLTTVLLFFTLSIVFYLLSKNQFDRIAKQAKSHTQQTSDHLFSSTQTRQSILAIAVFAANIYVLNLPDFLSDFFLFEVIPTFKALIFIGLFVFYLSMIWSNAHRAYAVIYGMDIDKKEYVGSNISFGVPVLLPWLLLSTLADLIMALPFSLPKRILSTPQGEAGFFLFFLFFVALTAPLIVQKFWGCKSLEDGYYRTRIASLCQLAGLKYADILYWPIFGGRMITAGVMGLVSRFRYILVTDALLGLLNPVEVDAVIAHEIGHVKKKHLLFYLFFFMGYMLIAYASFDFIIYAVLYSEPLYRFTFSTGINRSSVTTLLVSLAVIINFLLYFRYVFGYFMRNFERQADAFVYTLQHNASNLISTFHKISAYSAQSADKPNWHHFSISQRVKFLEKCEQDRTFIKKHDKKVNISILVFAIFMALTAYAGYELNFSDTGKKISNTFFETALKREIEKNSDNADLYGILADIYYAGEKYGEAVSAYENAIAGNSRNPSTLNNYAWLLATCPEKRFQRPEKALEIALQAAALEKSPHIMDTLAESYFVNGMFKEAVSAQETALKLAVTDRVFFKEKLEKYRKLAKESESQ